MSLVASLACGLCAAIAAGAQAQPSAYMLFPDWSYRLFDASLRVTRSGDLRAELLAGLDEPLRATVSETWVLRARSGWPEGTLNLLLGHRQASVVDGVLSVQLEPSRALAFIETPLETAYDVDFVQVKSRLLVSGWPPAAERTAESMQAGAATYEYDSTSGRLKRRPQSGLVVTPVACVVDGSLYNGRLFDIATQREISARGLPLGIAIGACNQGHVVGLANETVDEPVTLVVARVGPQGLVARRVVHTRERVASLNADEWRVSPDGEFVVRDTFDGRRRTGRVVVIRVRTGAQHEILLSRDPVNVPGILDFDPSGRTLLYASGTSLRMLSLEDGAVEHEAPLHGFPVGVTFLPAAGAPR